VYRFTSNYRQDDRLKYILPAETLFDILSVENCFSPIAEKTERRFSILLGMKTA